MKVDIPLGVEHSMCVLCDSIYRAKVILKQLPQGTDCANKISAIDGMYDQIDAGQKAMIYAVDKDDDTAVVHTISQNIGDFL